LRRDTGAIKDLHSFAIRRITVAANGLAAPEDTPKLNAAGGDQYGHAKAMISHGKRRQPGSSDLISNRQTAWPIQ